MHKVMFGRKVELRRIVTNHAYDSYLPCARKLISPTLELAISIAALMYLEYA